MSEPVTIWKGRIEAANKYHDGWAKTFRCQTLEEYRRGFQHKNWSNEGQRPYTLNMVFSTIEIKLSSYSFSEISFNVNPKPQKMDWNIELAVASAQAKQDVLNTLVNNPNANFQEEIESALVDSFFRFGLIEVGYSADWITNPNAGKPLYVVDVDPEKEQNDDDPEIARQPDAVPENELVFFKRIEASRFRVGGIEGRYLRQCNWFGYYDFYYANDIRASKTLRNTDKIALPSHRTAEFEEEYKAYSPEMKEMVRKGDLLKIWKIYDNRAKTCILWDESNDVVLYENPYKRIPILDLRWSLDTKGWYPIPPVFQWISPQDEVNEARNMMRSFRRRFVDQYQYQDGAIEQEEIDKFEQAKDGAVIKTMREGALRPIEKPSMSQVIPETMIIGKDDFVLMSGASSDSMGVGDRVTATQSLEISKRYQVRENREQIKVAKWLTRIGREALALACEKFIAGLWIKASADGGETFMGEVQNNVPVWDYITSEKLQDGVDYDVDVLVTSMSPVATEEEKRKFMEFIAIVSNYPQIALSPKLIREAAYRVGYRNESIIKEMQTAALMQMMGGMLGAGMQEQGNGGNRAAQMKTAQMTPNTNEQITNQLQGQLQ